MVPGSIKGEEYLRYATITEANQIVLEILDSNEGLKHKIVFLDELLINAGTKKF
ncbi:hypothetical protein ACFSCZ_02495 [Siminovitchia sediminis]|uniref:Uncharacterized protein n=1 Tax=Siminovitchia sediminis TaxID=1274353 RepID=A0ABW4KBS0_9BACI